MTEETQTPANNTPPASTPALDGKPGETPPAVPAPKPDPKPKAKAKRGPKAKAGVGGVKPGETPPLNELHRMSMETSRALAKQNNGNARQRAARRRRAKAI